MIRVLHLLGPGADFQAQSTSASLWRHVPPRIHITIHRTHAPGQDRGLLANYLHLRRLQDSFDMIHAWDIGSLGLAAMVCRRRPILFSPSFVARAGLDRARQVMRWANVRMVCSTASHHEMAIAREIPPERCTVIGPAILDAPFADGSYTALREGLGILSDEIVLLAPGESTRGAGHREAVWAASILHVYDSRFRLLIWGRGPQVGTLESLANRLRQPRVLIAAESALRQPIDFRELVNAADLVLASGDQSAPPGPLIACMAAGKPIVGVATGISGEVLVDGQTAAMVPARKPRLLAQRVLDLCADDALRDTIASKAAREAAERFHPERMVARFVETYTRMVNPARTEPVLPLPCTQGRGQG